MPFVRSLTPRLRSGQVLAVRNGRADGDVLAEPRAPVPSHVPSKVEGEAEGEVDGSRRARGSDC